MGWSLPIAAAAAAAVVAPPHPHAAVTLSRGSAVPQGRPPTASDGPTLTCRAGRELRQTAFPGWLPFEGPSELALVSSWRLLAHVLAPPQAPAGDRRPDARVLCCHWPSRKRRAAAPRVCQAAPPYEPPRSATGALSAPSTADGRPCSAGAWRDGATSCERESRKPLSTILGPTLHQLLRGTWVLGRESAGGGTGIVNDTWRHRRAKAIR